MLKDGGQAFPLPAGNFTGGENHQSEDGMSLRDYFAAKALQALIQIGQSLGSMNRGELAADAYLFADAMIAERSKS